MKGKKYLQGSKNVSSWDEVEGLFEERLSHSERCARESSHIAHVQVADRQDAGLEQEREDKLEANENNGTHSLYQKCGHFL